MSTLQEMLAARQAALKQAQEAGAVTGATTGAPKGEITDILNGKVAVGMQGSVEGSVQSNTTISDTAELDEAQAAESAAVFKNIRLRKHIASNGTLMRPQAGYFYLKQEKDIVDFNHYAKLGLVEVVTKQETK